MAGEIEDGERTNAIGLFNTARSYWHSAEHLAAANLKVTHPTAPVTFLFCHAIELYLKAYLRGNGHNVAQLKQIGHRLANLSRSATKAGLVIPPEPSEILSHIDDDGVAVEARYIVTGFKNLPTNEALSSVTTHLDSAVCTALAKEGFPVRNETFVRPDPQQENVLGVDTIRVLVHMFKQPDRDTLEFDIMAATLPFERGVLQYHLDRLSDAGFARRMSEYMGAIFWGLTPEGRRYVVERKLI